MQEDIIIVPTLITKHIKHSKHIISILMGPPAVMGMNIVPTNTIINKNSITTTKVVISTVNVSMIRKKIKSINAAITMIINKSIRTNTNISSKAIEKLVSMCMLKMVHAQDIIRNFNSGLKSSLIKLM
jgi:hypothetical protein